VLIGGHIVLLNRRTNVWWTSFRDSPVSVSAPRSFPRANCRIHQPFVFGVSSQSL